MDERRRKESEQVDRSIAEVEAILRRVTSALSNRDDPEPSARYAMTAPRRHSFSALESRKADEWRVTDILKDMALSELPDTPLKLSQAKSAADYPQSSVQRNGTQCDVENSQRPMLEPSERRGPCSVLTQEMPPSSQPSLETPLQLSKMPKVISNVAELRNDEESFILVKEKFEHAMNVVAVATEDHSPENVPTAAVGNHSMMSNAAMQSYDPGRYHSEHGHSVTLNDTILIEDVKPVQKKPFFTQNEKLQDGQYGQYHNNNSNMHDTSVTTDHDMSLELLRRYAGKLDLGELSNMSCILGHDDILGEDVEDNTACTSILYNNMVRDVQHRTAGGIGGGVPGSYSGGKPSPDATIREQFSIASLEYLRKHGLM